MPFQNNYNIDSMDSDLNYVYSYSTVNYYQAVSWDLECKLFIVENMNESCNIHSCNIQVVDRWLTLVSSPVSLPLVKSFIGQLSPDKALFASSLTPEIKLSQTDHNF